MMNKEIWTNIIKKLGKKNILLILGLAGILLIGLSGIVGGGGEDTTAATVSGEDSGAYARQLEQQLSQMISSITGAGECQVMVTLEQGTEYIYAVQEKNTQDTSQTSEESRLTAGERVSDEETYIMVSTENGEQPLVITELSPKVKGVVVVCEGGGEAGVSQTVRNAVATALNISIDRIYVVAGTIS